MYSKSSWGCQKCLYLTECIRKMTKQLEFGRLGSGTTFSPLFQLSICFVILRIHSGLQSFSNSHWTFIGTETFQLVEKMEEFALKMLWQSLSDFQRFWPFGHFLCQYRLSKIDLLHDHSLNLPFRSLRHWIRLQAKNWVTKKASKAHSGTSRQQPAALLWSVANLSNFLCPSFVFAYPLSFLFTIQYSWACLFCLCSASCSREL